MAPPADEILKIDVTGITMTFRESGLIEAVSSNV